MMVLMAKPLNICTSLQLVIRFKKTTCLLLLLQLTKKKNTNVMKRKAYVVSTIEQSNQMRCFVGIAVVVVVAVVDLKV